MSSLYDQTPSIMTQLSLFPPSPHLSPPFEKIPSHQWLVKYFNLNKTNGEWNEGQTGYVYLDNTFPSDPPPKLIMTTDEPIPQTVFSFDITNSIEFKLQHDKVLTWKSNEQETQEDLAISFLDKKGIDEIKQYISKIKGNICESDEDYNEDYKYNASIRENLPFIEEKLQPVCLRYIKYYILFNTTLLLLLL